MGKNIMRGLVMYLTGGIVYFYFEILVRGYSHISMFLLGGLCFLVVGMLGNVVLSININLLLKIVIIMFVATCIITVFELLTGLLVNEYLRLGVWDYSKMKYNYRGQICLLYSLIWAIMGLPCVYFYGIIDRFILKDDNGDKEFVYENKNSQA